jgi:hypothetical protein
VSDLHLTDEQVEELSRMGSLSKHEVKALRLWRDADAGPWYYDTNHDVYRERCSDSAPIPVVECPAFTRECENGRAIIHARNTAELRAALMYWGEKQHEQQSLYGCQLELGKSVGKDWEGWAASAAISLKINAIADALEKQE